MNELLSLQSDSQLHQVLIVQVFYDLNETYVGHSDFYGLHFMPCVHGQLPFGDGEFCLAVLCEASNQAVNLSVHQDGGRPSTRISKYRRQMLTSPKSECHAITN
jgi:hypothetical protein